MSSDDDLDRGSRLERLIGAAQIVVAGVFVIVVLASDRFPAGFKVFVLVGYAPVVLWGLERLLQRSWTSDLVDRWHERRRQKRRGS